MTTANSSAVGQLAGDDRPAESYLIQSSLGREKLFLLAILLLSALLRFGAIGDLPAGLQHDEAAYGIDARNVVGGAREIFFERSNGREPVYIYLLAGSFASFGVGVWQMRIVSAAVGLLTVAAVYRLTRDLYGGRSAVLAAAFFGFGYWPLHVSHTAFRAVTLPLFLTLAATALWRALLQGGVGRYALAGVLLGLTMYTYLSNRIVPLLLIAWLVAAWRFGKPQTGRPSVRGIAVLAVVWAVVFAPLGWYFWAHPDVFALRAVQVNDLRPILLEGDFRPLMRDTLNTLGMFTFRGDDSWKYNLSGRPVFEPLSGALFVAGLIVAAWRLARGATDNRLRSAFLLMWLALMLLPGAVSGESPHFLRTIGAQPVVFILPALAAGEMLARLPASRAPRMVVFTLAPIALLAYAGLSANDLFVRWASAPEQRAFFRADYRAAAQIVKADGDGKYVLAAEYPYDLDPTAFDLIAGGWNAGRWFDGQRALLVPAGGGQLLAPAFARPPELRSGLNSEITGPGGQAGLAGYDLTKIQIPVPVRPSDITVGPLLRFVGSNRPDTVRAGTTLTVALQWRTLAAGPADLSFSVKLVGPWESVWAQSDFSPAPPADWRPGDRLFAYHALNLDPALAPGIYRLTAQVYRRETLTVEPTSVGDKIDLGTVTVERGSTPSQAAIEPRFPTVAVFGDSAALVGYDLDKPVAAAGESLGLTIYWRSLGDHLPDLTVFTHLIHDGEPTSLYGQHDSQPVFGAYPTTSWQAGEVVRDRYDIAIDPMSPPGRYRIAVGMYRKETGERLSLRPLSLSFVDQAVRLLARLGLPSYERERIESDRVLLRPNFIERR